MKKLAISLICIFLIITFINCGGSKDENDANDGGSIITNTTPEVVKEKITDTVMWFFGIQANPDQSNITGRSRIRKKPSFLTQNVIGNKTRYRETASFNNDLIYIFGIPYTFISGNLSVSTYDYYGYPSEYFINTIVLEWLDVRIIYEKFGKSYDMTINGTQIVSGLLPASDQIIVESQNYSEIGTIDGIYTDISISEARLFFDYTSLYPTNESIFQVALNNNGTIYQFQCLFDGSYLVDVSIDSPITDSFAIDLTKGAIFEEGTGFNWSSITEESRNKVVLIRVYYGDNIIPAGHGTGCVISSDGIVVTNNHVVSYGTLEDILSRITVEFYKDHIAGNGITYEVQEINYSDKNYDLAYLKLPLNDLDYFTIGDSSQLKKGDDLLHIGHPETLEWWESKGIFLQNTYASYMDFNWLDPTTLIFQHSASGNHGSSGGAIINTDGELCGILFAGYPGSIESKAQIFALNTNYITSPEDLVFTDISTYTPEEWIFFNGNEILISPGTELNLPEYSNFTSMYEEVFEDVGLDYYYVGYILFYDLDGNNYADHFNAFIIDYYNFDYWWVFAWDNDGDQYIDIWAFDFEYDGVAN